jgi:glucose 1-dehydrogenase
MRLKDKVALVTGGGRGIGRGIAARLAKEGAVVIVNYNSSANEAAQVVAEIEQAGGRAIAYQADVGNLESHDGLLAVCEQFGGIDILVNNAGLEVLEWCLEVTPAAWDKTHDVNLKGCYFLSCKAAKAMKGRGGKIICISSVHDVQPLRRRAAYSSSKGGLLMMVKSLALELAQFGINVNGISPGAILTDMNRASLEDPAGRERMLSRIPAGRIGNPEDIAGAVAFLASSDSDYIHGTTIYVDGGLLLS